MPSKGCQTCKLRRIKCDEARPVCNRCAGSRRICVDANVAKQASFSIHIENSYASGKNQRPRGPRPSSTGPSLEIDLHTRALAYYLQYHLPTSADASKATGGLCGSVFAWINSGKVSALIDLALSSLALAVFARTQHHPPAVREASLRYQRLLTDVRARMTQVQMLQTTEACIDEVLLAIALLGRYECTASQLDGLSLKKAFKSMHSVSHHDGAMAVLKAWYHSPAHGTATDVIRQSRRGVIRSLLLRELSLPNWMLNGKNFGEHGLDLQHDRIVVQLVNLRCAIASLQENAHIQTVLFEQFRHKLHELHDALRIWAMRLPSTCPYLQEVLARRSNTPLDRPSISLLDCYYSNPEEAVFWSQYFTIQMMITSTRMKLVGTYRLTSPTGLHCNDEKQYYGENMKMASDGLASTIPFVLGRLEVQVDNSIRPATKSGDGFKPYVASLAVWQLTIASSLHGVDKRQQSWFRSMLATLGRITGDGVLANAESDEWPIF